MASRLNPYLSFAGTARSALEFYRDVFGGTVQLNTFGDFGGADSIRDMIMHGQLETDAGFTLMASDNPPNRPLNVGDNITVSLSGDDEALRGYWNRLSADGQVMMALEKQAWGDEYGMCIDKFGVPWLVNISGAKAEG